MKTDNVIKLNPATAIVPEKNWEAGATIVRHGELIIDSIIDNSAVLRKPDGTLDGLYPITDLVTAGWSIK